MATIVRRIRSATAASAFSSSRGGAPVSLRRSPSPSPFFRGTRLLSDSTPKRGSEGGRTSGGDRNTLRTKWENSLSWIGKQQVFLSELAEEYSGTEKVLKLVVGIGGSLYGITVGMNAAAVWFIDRRVDLKVAVEREKRLDFESKATRAHNDHIAKTQADWKKTQDNLFAFKDKVMLYQEKEMTTRHELMDAAKFFELSGYIIISADDFNVLKKKVEDLESRIPVAICVLQESVLDKEASQSALEEAVPNKEASQVPKELSAQQSLLQESVPNKEALQVPKELSAQQSLLQEAVPDAEASQVPKKVSGQQDMGTSPSQQRSQEVDGTGGKAPPST